VLLRYHDDFLKTQMTASQLMVGLSFVNNDKYASSTIECQFASHFQLGEGALPKMSQPTVLQSKGQKKSATTYSIHMARSITGDV